MKHAQEPWEVGIVSEGRDYDGIYIWAPGDSKIADDKFKMVALISEVHNYDELDTANANRIVECVNAFEGIDNPKEYINTLQVQILELKRRLHNLISHDTWRTEWYDKTKKGHEVICIMPNHGNLRGLLKVDYSFIKCVTWDAYGREEHAESEFDLIPLEKKK